MAVISNGTTISIAGSLVDATDISITASSTAVDTTTIGSLLSTSIQGRPTITGSATIHTDSATALALAEKFGGTTPQTAAVNIIINAAGAATGGIDFSGSAIITGFNPSWSNDSVQSASVSWQYTGQVTVTRAA